MKNEGIGLAELIQQVKRELLLPPDLSDSAPLLSVEEIDLEIGFTVTKKAEAGIHIQVVELGGSGERSDVHTVSVKLTPLLSHEERLTELRKDPRWGKIVQQQVESTLKGAEKAPMAPDEYNL